MDSRMVELLEQQLNEHRIDGAKEAEKACNEIFHEGHVRVSKQDLNLLLHYAGELFNIGTNCYSRWIEQPSSGTREDCEREGAFSLMDNFYKLHYRLINEIAGEKLSGELE